MKQLINSPKAPAIKQGVCRVLANEVFALTLQAELNKWACTGIQFEYTDAGVPESGKAIYRMYETALWGQGTFKVFNGANDAALLFFTPSVNLAYRAVHDLDHAKEYTQGRGTTKLVDELYLNCLMAKRVYNYAMANGYTEEQALMVFFCVYHDTVGQVHYYREHNDFCVDQKANTETLLGECVGIKALSEGGVVLARLIMIGHLNTCNVGWTDV